jgi:hypothetical protein
VSVDTYLQRKDTSTYQVVEGEDIQVLVSPLLAQQAQWIHVDLQKFLFWKSLSVYAER